MEPGEGPVDRDGHSADPGEPGTSDGPSVQVAVSYSLPEVRRALTYVAGTRVLRRSLVFLGGVALLLWGTHQPWWLIALGLVSGVATIAWSMLVRHPRRAMSVAPSVTDWTITPAGLTLRSPGVAVTVAWGQISRLAVEASGFFVFRGGSRTALFLPRRCLRAGDGEIIESLARQAGVSVQGQAAGHVAR